MTICPNNGNVTYLHNVDNLCVCYQDDVKTSPFEDLQFVSLERIRHLLEANE